MADMRLRAAQAASNPLPLHVELAAAVAAPAFLDIDPFAYLVQEAPANAQEAPAIANAVPLNAADNLFYFDPAMIVAEANPFDN